MGCAESMIQERQVHQRDKINKINAKPKNGSTGLKRQNFHQVKEEINAEQAQRILKTLKNHFLFSNLDTQRIQNITKIFKKCQCNAQEYLFQQHEAGSHFFIINKGKMQVEINSKPIKIIQDNEAFGQLALMYSAPRSTSIKCLSQKTLLFCLQQRQFQKALDNIQKNALEQVKDLISNVQIFKYLTSRQRWAMLSSLTKVKYAQGEIIFNLDDDANSLYIIQQGEVKIQIPNKQAIYVKQYQYFGEGALNYSNSQVRSGIATAMQQTICFVLDFQTMKEVLSTNINNVLYFNIERWALKRSSCFSNSPERIIYQIMNTANVQKAKKGDILKKKKVILDRVIIPLDCKLNNSDQIVAYGLQEFEQSINKRDYQLKVTKDGNYAVIPFDIITRKLKLMHSQRQLASRYHFKTIKKINQFQVSIRNFNQKQKLGEGQFGAVFLAIDRKFGSEFAVKVIKKTQIAEEGLMQSVQRQKCYLQQLKSPFIQSFYKAQEDKDNIYLILEYIKGVQLFDVLREIGLLPDNISKYYIASLVFALEEMHQKNIMYRDIKPENTIITNQGKVSLIDLGTAKKLDPENGFRTFTLIGTPHYMAPQMTESNGYSLEIDYWAIGVMLYEFAFGKMPFGQKMNDPYQIFRQVRKKDLTFPLSFNRVINKDLIEAIQMLLVRVPTLRLKNGWQDLKQSAYFKSFDWAGLISGGLQAPYIPKKFKNGRIKLKENSSTKKIRQFKFDSESLKQWEFEI